MRKWLAALLLTLTLAAVFSRVALAGAPPVGECPAPFQPHMWMPHHDHDGHVHIGITQDLNGDGWTCMREVGTGTLHVHIDNVRPAR